MRERERKLGRLNLLNLSSKHSCFISPPCTEDTVAAGNARDSRLLASRQPESLLTHVTVSVSHARRQSKRPAGVSQGPGVRTAPQARPAPSPVDATTRLCSAAWRRHRLAPPLPSTVTTWCCHPLVLLPPGTTSTWYLHCLAPSPPSAATATHNDADNAPAPHSSF